MPPKDVAWCMWHWQHVATYPLPFPLSIVEWCESRDGMLKDFPSLKALRLFTSWANCSAADRAGGTLPMSVMGNRRGKNMTQLTGTGDCTWRLLEVVCLETTRMLAVNPCWFIDKIGVRYYKYLRVLWYRVSVSVSRHEPSSGPLFSLHCALISLGFASATLIADGKWLQRLFFSWPQHAVSEPLRNYCLKAISIWKLHLGGETDWC